MSTLQHDLPGARVLDLFAGSGALGLEAVSRGAAHATFVEKAAGPLKALQSNIRQLDAAEDVEVVKADAVTYAAAQPALAFDIALADPPYDTDEATRVLDAFAKVPFARILCIEHRASARLAVPADAQTRRYGDTAITYIMAAQ